MPVLWAIATLVFSFVAAAYLQIPTFVLALGYGWSHAFGLKRWVLRLAALAAFAAFLFSAPPAWAIGVTAVPSVFFWVFSLFNANPNIFRALDAAHIVKGRAPVGDGAQRVVGLCAEGIPAVCYPLESMVIPRHVLNDDVGDRPVLISFCAACRSSLVYDRAVAGRVLSFEVVGVRRRNLILRDRETGTLWQQGTGQAVFGALSGLQLDMLPSQQMRLADWLSLHPDSQMASEAPGAPKGLIPERRLLSMLEVTKRLVAPGLTPLTGLALRERVWGVTIGDRSKAYPMSQLRRVSSFGDRVGSTDIEIRYNPTTDHIEGWERTTGKRLILQSHWWLGWKEFHPDTEIWEASSGQPYGSM